MMRYMREATEIMDKIDELMDRWRSERYVENKRVLMAQMEALMWAIDTEKDEI
jgi:hypothetical protein